MCFIFFFLKGWDCGAAPSLSPFLFIHKQNYTMEKPENCRDIWVTYKKDGSIVTRHGFYLEYSDEVSVPPDWRVFNGVLLPHGFGGDHMKLKDIINWEYKKD